MNSKNIKPKQNQIQNNKKFNPLSIFNKRKTILIFLSIILSLILMFILGYIFFCFKKNKITTSTNLKNLIEINNKNNKKELEYGYSTDGQFVYYRDSNKNIIRGADPKSFVVLDEYYSKDKSNFYYQLSAIEEADYDTFQILGYGYAKDKNTIFLGNHPGLYTGDSPNDKEFLKLEKKIDIASFVVLSYVYFKDKNIVMYDNRHGGTDKVTEIIGADSDTFEVITGEYSKDKNNIYFQSVKSDITDYNTLDYNLKNDTYGFYSTDKNGVYFGGRKIIEADLSTFEVITCQMGTGCFAKDKNNIYSGGDILKKISETRDSGVVG